MPPTSQPRGTVRRLSASVNKLMATRSADQGYGQGGPWPEEPNSGDYTCVVRALTINRDDTFEFKPRGAKEKKKLPALSLQFAYTYRKPEGDALDFDGEKLTIPYDIAGLPEDGSYKGGKQQTRVGIQLGRIKGHYKGLFGAEAPDDMEAVIEEMERLFTDAASNGSEVEALVGCVYTKEEIAAGNGRAASTMQKKRDFIRELVAGPAGGDATEEAPAGGEAEPEQGELYEEGGEEQPAEGEEAPVEEPEPAPPPPTRRAAPKPAPAKTAPRGKPAAAPPARRR